MMDKFENRGDEISFKELVEAILGYVTNFVKEWKITAVLMIPILIFFIYQHKNYKNNFIAETKFVVEGGNSIGSGLGGLLGQIGLRSAVGGSKLNNYKILEVAKSKKLLGGIILSKFNGDFIANHLIKSYELNKVWSKSKQEYTNFKFTHDNIKKFNRIESSAYAALLELVKGGKNAKNPILYTFYDEDTGIFSIKSNCVNEDLTLKLAELNYDMVKHFFEDELLESQIKTSSILKFKTDSIQNLIKRKTAQIANIQDRSYGLVQATPSVNRAALEKEILALSTAQAEFIKSYEMADIGLRDIRASFILIDETIGPLEAIESSLIFSIIKAIGIACILGFLFSSLKLIYNNS